MAPMANCSFSGTGSKIIVCTVSGPWFTSASLAATKGNVDPLLFAALGELAVTPVGWQLGQVLAAKTVGAGADAVAAAAQDHGLRRRFEHRPAATIAQRQADQRGALACPDKLLRLIDGGALFEHVPAEEQPRHAVEVEFRRRRPGSAKTWWTASASPASFMPEMQPKIPGKPIETKACFPLGRRTDDQAVSLEQAGGGKIEVPAEQRAAGGAPPRLRPRARSSRGPPAGSTNMLPARPDIAVDSQPFGISPHLGACSAEICGASRLQLANSLWQQVAASEPLEAAAGDKSPASSPQRKSMRPADARSLPACRRRKAPANR